MVKQKRKAVKAKVKEEKKQEVKTPPSPSQVGLGQEFQLETAAGTPAATVTTEEGAQVQVGQVEQAELNEQIQKTQQQEESEAAAAAAAKTLHPVLGTVFESYVTKYKDRPTEFCTFGKNLTSQPKYPFKGKGKQKVRITLSEDGRKVTVERW